MKNNVDYLKIIGKLEKLLYARTNVLVRNLKILTCPLAACHVFEKGGIVCLKGVACCFLKIVTSRQ